MNIKFSVMKFRLFFIASVLLSLNSFAAQESTNQAKTETPAPAPTKLTGISTYYGYSYRSFVGISNPNSPVYLKDGDMHLHVLALRYNFTDKWAVRVGSAYLIHNLNFLMMNQNQTVSVEGFSDVRTAAVYTAFKDKIQSLDFSLGLSLPTALTLREDDGRPLPPQDQFSSGTYDIITTINYGYNYNDFTFTQKLDQVTHTGENAIGYRLGDDFGFTSSVSYSYHPYLIPSFALHFIDRKDLAVNHLPNPKSAKVSAGSGWEGTLALRSGMPLKSDQTVRMGFEAGAPIFRSSRTSDYTIGQTLWYVAANVMAAF